MGYPSLFDRLLGHGLVFFPLLAVFLVSALAWADGNNYTAAERFTPFISGFLLLWARRSRRRVLTDRRRRQEIAAVTGEKPGRAARIGERILAVVYVLAAVPIAFVAFYFTEGFVKARWGISLEAGLAAWIADTRNAAGMSGLTVIVAVTALLPAIIVARRWLVSRRRGRRSPLPPKGWDGTVAVLLPVPKDE